MSLSRFLFSFLVSGHKPFFFFISSIFFGGWVRGCGWGGMEGERKRLTR